MAFTEETQWQVELFPPYKDIGIKEMNVIKQDGTAISRTNKRHRYHPGTDISKLPCQEAKDMAEVFWTKDVIDKWKAYMETLYKDPLVDTQPGLKRPD